VVLHAVADDTYDLCVMRSFAVSLWEWLAETAGAVAAGRP
jgi:sarcosine oxidase gamma subunit